MSAKHILLIRNLRMPGCVVFVRGCTMYRDTVEQCTAAAGKKEMLSRIFDTTRRLSYLLGLTSEHCIIY